MAGTGQDKLKVVFDELSKAPKQLKALTTYIQLSNFFNVGNQLVKKQKVIEKGDISSSVINQLIKKDPTEQLSHPRLEKKLPVFLNIQEVEKLLEKLEEDDDVQNVYHTMQETED